MNSRARPGVEADRTPAAFAAGYNRPHKKKGGGREDKNVVLDQNRGLRLSQDDHQNLDSYRPLLYIGGNQRRYAPIDGRFIPESVADLTGMRKSECLDVNCEYTEDVNRGKIKHIDEDNGYIVWRYFS